MNSLHNVQMHTWQVMSIHSFYMPRSAEQIFITFHVNPMTLYRTPQRYYCNTTGNVWQTHKSQEGAKLAPPTLGSSSDIWQCLQKKVLLLSLLILGQQSN